MMEFLRAISFFASVGAVAAFLFLTVIRPFFSPSGWTKKENDGVAVRFKVFLPLYLQNPEKWKLMPEAARYENTIVYFSTGIEWRKYNRWRKRVRKQRQKAEQEERQRKFMEAIFKEYEPKPNTEFTTEKGEDCFIVKCGKGNPIVAILPKPYDGLGNAEIDKIRADLMLTVQEQEKQNNPRCKDCVHMRYKQRINSEKFDTVCVRHITKLGLEHIWPEMTACGIFEERRREVRDYAKCGICRQFDKGDNSPLGYCFRNDEIVNEASVKGCFEPKSKAEERPEPLGTVTTHQIPTSEHYE